jgi:predicted amidohydrolase
MDVAILNGKVEDVEPRISESNAKRVIDASGMIVTPGLVDIHTHTAYDVVRLSIDPEQACLPKGSTTVVDAGSTGELIFRPFKKFVIERSRCRVLAFLNVESLGMIEFADIQPNNTDQGWPKLLTSQNEIYAPLFINLEKTINTIRDDRDNIVGIKWAHHGLKEIGRASSMETFKITVVDE